MKQNIFLILLISVITSCATTYEAPTSGDMATLVLPVKDSSWRFLGGFSSGSISFAIKGDDGCGTRYKQLEPASDGDQVVEVDIPANKGVFVVFNANSGNTVCSVAGEFTALPNARYKVQKVGGGYQCLVGVVEVAADGSERSVSLSRAYPDTMTGNKICDER